jgi:photosystem II stability/assembly factor-like uncharacterized protein
MNDLDLERWLRDHYQSRDAGSSGRAASRVADALDRAPARSWSLALFVPARAAIAAVGSVAIVAVVVVALLPVWHADMGGRTASSASAAHSLPNQLPGATFDPVLVGAEASQTGMGRDGTVWALRGSNPDFSLDISIDHGRTWRVTSAPGGTTFSPGGFFDLLDADHIWYMSFATADPYFMVYRTVDGGTTWQSTALPVTYGPFDRTFPGQLTFINASVGFAMLGYTTGVSYILKTVDGGATWAITGSAVLPENVVASDANTLWVSAIGLTTASDPFLKVSRDSGATWSNVQLPGLGVTVLGQQECGGNGNSGGDLWVPSDGLLGPSNSFTFLSPAEGYVAVACANADFGTHYYRTTDGGLTWSLVSAVAQAMNVAAAVGDADHLFQPAPRNDCFAPSSGVIPSVAPAIDCEATDLLGSADGGKTWTTIVQDALGGEEIAWLQMADAQNGAALGIALTPAGPASSGAVTAYNAITPLYLTWDGGKTWHPADFTAR